LSSEAKLNWRSDGSDDARPVVLIHGLCESMRVWAPVVPALAREHRVVRVDLLGFGESPQSLGSYRIEDHADAVSAALHAAGVREAVLVGHSMGGSVSVAVAERESALARSLVLVNAPPTKESRTLSRTERALRTMVVGETAWRLMRDSDRRAGLSSAFAPGFQVPDVFVEDLARTTHAAFAGSSLGLDRFLEQRPLAERVAALGIPTTVIFGIQDQRVNSASLAPFEQLDGVTVHRLLGSGHSPMWEEPERAAELIAQAAWQIS
jgi:pimeloyl-ACP methyl ester carboxylesterase